MNQGREKATESVEQAHEAGQSLRAIEAAVSNINKMNTQISSASDNQRHQAEMVNNNVKQISDVAENGAFAPFFVSELNEFG